MSLSDITLSGGVLTRMFLIFRCFLQMLTLKLLFILYVDDIVIMSESVEGMNNAFEFLKNIVIFGS